MPDVNESQACQEVLNRTIKHQKILMRILGRIRASVNLEALCSSTCQDICQELQVERVTLFRFNEDWSGNFINNFGYVQKPWDTISAFGENKVWEDTHLQETKGGRYRRNEPFAVADVYAVGHARCHIELLEQFQVRAYALAPIFVGSKLWGLLAAYQHSAPHQWDDVEVEFLSQCAVHLGIAIQRTRELEEAVARQRALSEVVGNIRSSLDTKFIFDTTCRDLCKLLKLERTAIYRFNEDWSGEFISNFAMVEPQWESPNPI